MQCADCDPIIHAGCIECGKCKARSWAVEAEWVDENFILAVYESVHERSCPERMQFGLVLLNVEDGDRTVQKIQRPPRPHTNRCKAITRSGERCRNGLKDGDYCGVHAARQRQETS